MLNHKRLRRSLESATRDGEPGRFFLDLESALAEGHLRPEDFSLSRLFQEMVPNGRELFESFSPQQSGGFNIQVLETAEAVDTSAFSNIIGQITYTKMIEAFNDPKFIWPDLCEVIPTQFNGEKIPGIGRIGDRAEDINEAGQYPYAGVGEEWVETPVTRKRGFIVPVTKEAIFFDRTGLLLRRAGEVSQWLGVNIEKRVLDAVFGITNTYKRNGRSGNTYLTSGDYINTKTSNGLVDWTDIENAELLFDAITDPNTAEPIMIMANTIVVPTALKATAQRILTATEVQHSGDTTADHIRTVGGNPITTQYKILTSPYVKSRTSSATTWFIGDPKKAFAYMQNWGVQVIPAPQNSEADFNQDIVARFKVSERGEIAVLEPRYMVKNTA